MDTTIWATTAFTVLMGLLSTLVAMPLAMGVAWLLARRHFRGKPVVETVVTLPLVLPPVATGYLLLQMLGVSAPVGRLLDAIGVEVVFTWKAVVLAMVVMSLPLLVLTLRTGFEQIDRRYEQVAATLGASPWRVWITVTLPLARRSIVVAALLGFARALGEFGATIIVAGGIPGQTQTLAVALFTFIESGRDAEARDVLWVSLALAALAVLTVQLLRRREGQP
ncbi:MAG: molybdate ABC transporter permease subunit [Acidobacteria bacterium]|nr:molybdate ABC transporter permease subunit [Acidobacteriota bacterium]